jgi:aryl-alcohol dehydrogenase-like predicted oxidoreductase
MTPAATTPPKPLLADGAPARDALDQLDAVRTVLTGHGRSQAQSARLAVGAQRPCDPILRSRTLEQVEQNVAALSRGLVQPDQVAAIESLLGRARTG